jgi:hypothetical protein
MSPHAGSERLKIFKGIEFTELRSSDVPPPLLRKKGASKGAVFAAGSGTASEVANGLSRSGGWAAGRHVGMFAVAFDMAPE